MGRSLSNRWGVEASRNVFPTTFLVVLAFPIVFVYGCASEGESEDHTYGLRVELNGEPPERTWVKPDVEKTATLSSGETHTLFNPAAVWILSDGHVYVWDAGDFKLKVFTPEGEYVTAYGEGRGNGPGEVQVYRNLGLHGDSLYVYDPENRRLSLFGPDAAFGRSQQYDEPLAHFAMTDDSTRYELYRGPGTPPSMEVTPASGQKTTISDLLIRDVSTIVFGGYLYAVEGKGIYVLDYYPLLLSVSPGDTTLSAHPTPEYGEAPMPEPRIEGEGIGRMIRPPSNRLHWLPTVYDEVLSIQRASPEDTIAFDLYDTGEMRYLRSLRLPVKNSHSRFAYGLGLLAVERDTTVVIYRVERPEH